MCGRRSYIFPCDVSVVFCVDAYGMPLLFSHHFCICSRFPQLCKACILRAPPSCLSTYRVCVLNVQLCRVGEKTKLCAASDAQKVPTASVPSLEDLAYKLWLIHEHAAPQRFHADGEFVTGAIEHMLNMLSAKVISLMFCGRLSHVSSSC